ncbi:MAG: Putative transposase, partial [uncultured Rubrobacteraceae bacterium]
ARLATIHHRAYLARVPCPAARAQDRPPLGLPPAARPRQGGLREAGAGIGVRLRLREDRGRVLLGEHAAPQARRVDRAGVGGELATGGVEVLRPLHRPGVLGGGGGLLHHQGPLRRGEVGQEPGGPREAGHQALGGRGRQRHTARVGDGARQPPRLAAVGPHPGGRPGARLAAGGREGPPRPRLRLEAHPRAAAGARARRGDLAQGHARAAERDLPLGDRAHQLLAERPQEAAMVHREAGEGRGILDGPLGGGRHRGKAREGRLEALPLGGTASPQAV